MKVASPTRQTVMLQQVQQQRQAIGAKFFMTYAKVDPIDWYVKGTAVTD